MFQTLLMLIAVFLFDHTFGKALNSQCNNRDINQKDSRGMQCAKEMLWSDQANFYTNPLKSEPNDGPASTIEQLSVPNDGPASTIKQLSVPNDGPASTIKQRSLPNEGPAHLKQLSVPNDSPAHFKQLSVPTKSLATTPRNLFLLCNKDNSEYYDSLPYTSCQECG
jgi:hypothetical protein